MDDALKDSVKSLLEFIEKTYVTNTFSDKTYNGKRIRKRSQRFQQLIDEVKENL